MGGLLMQIRRAIFVAIVALLAIPGLADPALAGGRPDPAPRWLGTMLTLGLLGFGAFLVAVLAVGAYRRRHP
jgi:hypothetical protein